MSTQSLKRQSINPPHTQVFYDTFHYSQATRVGDMIWVSGQVGIDATMTPGKDIGEQAQLAFQGLKTILEAAGATLADVVELMTFHTELQADMQAFAQVKDQYFPDRYPAWTAVGTTQLALPGLRVEIRAVAVAGSGEA
ncbi:RidA family protein [Pseudomonas aeruginosa]|uniref:RidA family protein n=1 Tax=Pseudomonas aeruginosa TaxID=287 RepID=UPI001A9517F5|nr:RidA family protein [Pseudomonas aeruginosa]MBO0968695.1 RidA family protein [Pseudomonas aeruginosa]MCV4103388.1 RidA family protein [Pseudomonas aeruginosa]MDG4275152.1 RidA family protein [Pseudomonas aeruginosa]HBO3911207.1 RidA family protein [Pseudomonas aeruginosa]HCF5874569.1 RidA family protein [Pseudomonas aeruginosa]